MSSNREHTGRTATGAGIMPLIVDAVLPIASYYLLKAGGASTLAALALSSVVPAVRTVWSLVKDRRVNGLAALILAANLVGLLLSLVVGDPRLMLAKDSGITGTVGLAMLVSAFGGRPLASALLTPLLTRGDAARVAVVGRLRAGSERFRRTETLFSLMWGGALLGESVVRVVGAYTVPIDTMVGLGGLIAAVTIVVSGRLAVAPMEKVIASEMKAGAEPMSGTDVPVDAR
ncbi:VC0807 family protein [Streptomyces sp. 21So2-11]|uniref:VC0807 family protein n=1 Tax=Streptomyces sp. 21So2-11 TaxID=3144408 RepID=UPI00321A7CB3